MSARRERELDRTNCPGRPDARRTAEKPTAKKLGGDPQDLIRAMPAKGDRPAGPFCDHKGARVLPGPGHNLAA